MKIEIFPICSSCGNANDESTVAKCKSCGFTARSTKKKWKEANMGKQRNQPKWIAEDQQKNHKKR